VDTLNILSFSVNLNDKSDSNSLHLDTNSSIILATTTSTYDSGLLDYLLPFFEGKTGIEVRVIPVGTGQALELGRRGDADVILAHSPKDEERFIAEGFGIERRCVMYNDFVVLGPEEDIAGIRNLSIIDSFIKIADRESVFISRGDNSGTHRKEIRIWAAAGVQDRGRGYIETGTGMGQTLFTASEKGGYTLSDRATYLSLRDRLELSILVSGEKLLLNPYHIIAINPEKNSGVNYEDAEVLVQWITSDEAKALIGKFTRDSHQLFTPLNNRCLED
jgi:tungstate transport system substrate-binding protein